MTENHAQGTPLFDTVLVANRGEIAVRVIRTLRRLGIRSVAVHSDADADARHVREADTAVRLGPAPARESYLDIDAVVDAARRTGAQAVHPGYGFLSENADFARALEAAGIVFVGPPVGSLDAMADKIRAKETVAAYDVPVVPGIQDPTLTDEQITAEAERVGFPLLIKPSAGGGGKGMVAVRAAEELPGALASARRTARSAFGDDTLLLERLITAPRHIEVQVFADAHGATVHLGERECSLQRRHQKVIEEAPAPLLTGLAHGAELRERLGRAAVDAAVSVGYRGAGTVEFLVSDENPDEFFFMEMNTRLQVEHPVSEEVVRVRGQRLDFVELQLRIAAGGPLGFAQEDVTLDGAAVEARVYAEDPANGFLPSTGPVLRWREPAGEGVRVDTLLLPSRPAEERAFGSGPQTGPAAGAVDPVDVDGAQPEITGFYDPMIAKLIARGADRAEEEQCDGQPTDAAQPAGAPLVGRDVGGELDHFNHAPFGIEDGVVGRFQPDHLPLGIEPDELALLELAAGQLLPEVGVLLIKLGLTKQAMVFTANAAQRIAHGLLEIVVGFQNVAIRGELDDRHGAVERCQNGPLPCRPLVFLGHVAGYLEHLHHLATAVLDRQVSGFQPDLFPLCIYPPKAPLLALSCGQRLPESLVLLAVGIFGKAEHSVVLPFNLRQ